MGRAEVLLGRMAHSVVGRGMPMGRGRSGGGVRLRPVSGIRGEGGGVLLMIAHGGRSEWSTCIGAGGSRVWKAS